MNERCTDDQYQELCELLREIHVWPQDLVRELRKEGHRIKFLSELSEETAAQQIADCKRALA